MFRNFYIFLLIAILGVILFASIGGFLLKPEQTGSNARAALDESSLIPTKIEPVEVGNRTTPVITYTLDASDIEKWVFFDFSRGSVIEKMERDSLDWDIAFKRAKLLTNGGATNKEGKGGALAVNLAKIHEVASVPEGTAFETDYRPYKKPERENRALVKWFKYNYINHRLEPKPEVYVIRTADGRFAKMKILSYYCQGEKVGCYTFQYLYQGKETVSLR